MAKPGKPIPDGYRSVTPYLKVKNTAEAIDSTSERSEPERSS